MAEVDEAEGLHRARAAVLRVGLVGVEPVDVEAGHVHVRAPGRDSVRRHAAEPAAREDADGVQADRICLPPCKAWALGTRAYVGYRDGGGGPAGLGWTLPIGIEAESAAGSELVRSSAKHVALKAFQVGSTPRVRGRPST